MELFTLTPKKRTGKDIGLAILFLILSILGLIWTLFGAEIFSGSRMVSFLVTAGLIFLWVTFQFRRNFEYEFAYFDGSFKVVRIANKARRKLKIQFVIEDVMQIAPAGDSSVSHYEKDANAKHYDFASDEEGGNPYVIALHKPEGLIVMRVEMDDRMLDEICKKHRSKVIRK